MISNYHADPSLLRVITQSVHKSHNHFACIQHGNIFQFDVIDFVTDFGVICIFTDRNGPCSVITFPSEWKNTSIIIHEKKVFETFSFQHFVFIFNAEIKVNGL